MMREELESVTTEPSDDLATRPRAEVEEAARKWFAIASDMRDQRDTVAQDLEAALNLCHFYQETLVRVDLPDPHIVEVRKLLTKYGMSWTPPENSSTRIYMDGKDITTYPDSTDATAVDLELPSGIEVEIVGVEVVELEDGTRALRPVFDEVHKDYDIPPEDAAVISEDEEPNSERLNWLLDDEGENV